MSSNANNQFRVLVTDDTKTIRNAFSSMLVGEGYLVSTAENGYKAIDIANSLPIDIILLDIVMLDSIDGFETCRLLKAGEKTKDIPVIFLSALNDTVSKVKGFEAGGVDFVEKALNKVEILSRIKTHVRLSQLTRQMERQLGYTDAILNSQKNFLVIYNANFTIERANDALKNFLGVVSEKEIVPLVRRFKTYEEYALPHSDKELIEELYFEQNFKTTITNNRGVEKIVSLYASKKMIMDEQKYIIDFSDITLHEKARIQEIELLRYSERYHVEQQKDAFRKQLKIIRDEASHLRDGNLFVDSYYKPFDVMSGDTYGTLNLGYGKYLFYVIDAMGKGLSASVTSIQSTSFINNAVDTSLEKSDFNFEKIVDSFLHFIKKQLLTEELLCVIFVFIDMQSSKFKVANYGMPPIVVQNKNGEVESIDPNNLPIMPFFNSKTIDEYELKEIAKMLICSDGIVEGEVEKSGSAKSYDCYLNDDFVNSSSAKDFLEKFQSKVEKFEDDQTFIYFRFLDEDEQDKKEFELAIDFNNISSEIEKFKELISGFGMEQKSVDNVCVALNELIYNAYEHGIVKIGADRKQHLIESDEYLEYLLSQQERAEVKDKKIKVSFGTVKAVKHSFLIISVSNDDSGFVFYDMMKNIKFENSAKLHGRGIGLAKEMSDGIFFNKNGNTVYLMKLLKA